jgi:pimeloyl-ACP methyl ester carboxylesterase
MPSAGERGARTGAPAQPAPPRAALLALICASALIALAAGAALAAGPAAAAARPAGAAARPAAEDTAGPSATAAEAESGTAVPLALSRCSRDNQDRSQCGTVRVPLDRSGALAGEVDLRVRLLDPKRGAPQATVIALAGGPGQAATPLLEQLVRGLGDGGRSRRVVTFDQRGTGASGRLACAASTQRGGGTLSASVGRCAEQIGPRRAAFTTAASVADLEAVRAALRAERIVLYGTSYGTKVALDYAAAHPERVERLLLDSVVPPEGVDPFQRATFAAMPRVLDGVCGRACPFTRAPQRDLAALVRRLARAPLRGTAPDGRGRPRPVSVTRADLFALLLLGDLDPYVRAALPAAVSAALHGDAAPLLRLAARRGDGAEREDDSGDSEAVYLATTCEDGQVPWPAGTPPASRRAAVNAAAAAIPDADFAPFDRATVRVLGSADLCRAWPESPIEQPAGPLPDVPALILSGDDDLRTPRADAEAVAAQLPRAVVLHVPNAGHAVLGADPSDCAEDGAAAFLDGRGIAGCRQRRRLVIPSVPPPRRLADLRLLRGSGGRVGRTVAAVLATYGDAAEQVVAQVVQSGGAVTAFGGLRAGSATLDPDRGLRLRGYSFVPGVTIDGLVRPDEPQLTLKVGGAAAAAGSVTISAGGIRGRLDGETVRISASALRGGGSGDGRAALARAASAPLAGLAAASQAAGAEGAGARPAAASRLPGGFGPR